MSLLLRQRPLLILLLSDILVFLSHVTLGKKLGFFHLEKEGNLGSLQAGIKFWIAATVAYISAWILFRAQPKQRAYSWLLVIVGTGLAYIGLDDMMALHERLGFVVNNLLGNGGFNGESFNWLLYFLPFIILALVAFAITLSWLKKHHRTAFYLFFIGVILCVSSIGAEWLGGTMITSDHLSVKRYRLLILMEEGLEMVGASFLTAALIGLAAHLTRSHLRIEQNIKPEAQTISTPSQKQPSA